MNHTIYKYLGTFFLLLTFIVWSRTVIRTESSIETGQIYFVSGYSELNLQNSVATELYQLSTESKSLVFLSTLLPKPDTIADTVSFIRAYYDNRLLIYAKPSYNPTNYFIVDMDDPCRTRNFKINDRMDSTLYSYIIDSPNKGLIIAEILWSDKEGQPTNIFFNINTEKHEEFIPNDFQYVIISGLSGIGHDDRSWLDFLVDADGILFFPWSDVSGRRQSHKMDWPLLPKSLVPVEKNGRMQINGIEKQVGGASLVIANKNFKLLSIRDSTKPTEPVFQLFKKSTNSWQELRIPTPGAESIQFKSFGKWLAGIPLGNRHTVFTSEIIEKIYAEQRQNDYRYQALVGSNPMKEIFIYDTESEKHYIIPIEDIESEVLLIENNIVYYRVQEKLYRVSINNEGVGKPELLAQDPASRNIYWAFTSSKSCGEIPK